MRRYIAVSSKGDDERARCRESVWEFEKDTSALLVGAMGS